MNIEPCIARKEIEDILICLARKDFSQFPLDYRRGVKFGIELARASLEDLLVRYPAEVDAKS